MQVYLRGVDRLMTEPERNYCAVLHNVGRYPLGASERTAFAGDTRIFGQKGLDGVGAANYAEPITSHSR